jgi:hypothetical protein
MWRRFFEAQSWTQMTRAEASKKRASVFFRDRPSYSLSDLVDTTDEMLVFDFSGFRHYLLWEDVTGVSELQT